MGAKIIMSLIMLVEIMMIMSMNKIAMNLEVKIPTTIIKRIITTGMIVIIKEMMVIIIKEMITKNITIPVIIMEIKLKNSTV